uniref:Uncharacterized protein n=1 Tax=viral metagenome TaxID=1070528 RepID=A0A6C0LFD3_9ZZZZ
MDDIIDNFGYISISENNELLTYIRTLDIDYNLKKYLYDLIKNDNHTDYLTIYNICMENDIELPPF